MGIGRRRVAEIDDRALVTRARRGDRDAMAELLGRHRRLVCSIAKRVTGGGPHLDDVIQEALVAALEGLPRFRGDSKVSTWLAAVTARTATKWVERQARGEAPTGPGETAADVGHQVELRDRAARLSEAVDRLPADQRAVVCLRHMEGLSVREVADARGIPEGTVKSRLHYARQQLRRVLMGGERE